MKKIIIIFVCIILLSLIMVSSVFADFGYVFDGKYSVLTASGLFNCPFYSEDEDEPTNFMAYKVSLKPDTEYTFISTKGSRRFFFGDYVTGVGTHFYSSTNLLPIDSMLNSAFVKNNDGSYTLSKLSDIERFTKFVDLYLPYGTYTLTVNILSGDTSLFFQIYTDEQILYGGFDSSGSFTFTGTPIDMRFYLDGSVPDGSTSVIFNVSLNEGDTSLPYEPYWSDTIYSDNFTTVYNFKTPKYASTYLSNSNLYDFIIGINDVTSGNENELFSRYQSEENIFYLVEGSYSVEDISLILDGNRYQNGYNDGFNQGYKEGEYDGMNSTSIFKSVILTVLSGPFVVVSNALNFEIFGINIYTFIQIILTILIVAFLITRLKGRE